MRSYWYLQLHWLRTRYARVMNCGILHRHAHLGSAGLKSKYTFNTCFLDQRRQESKCLLQSSRTWAKVSGSSLIKSAILGLPGIDHCWNGVSNKNGEDIVEKQSLHEWEQSRPATSICFQSRMMLSNRLNIAILRIDLISLEDKEHSDSGKPSLMIRQNQVKFLLHSVGGLNATAGLSWPNSFSSWVT